MPELGPADLIYFSERSFSDERFNCITVPPVSDLKIHLGSLILHCINVYCSGVKSMPPLVRMLPSVLQ